MSEHVQRLIKEAEKAFQNTEYVEAGRYYEKAAETTHHEAQSAKLLKKAAEAYREGWMKEDAERCFKQAIELMDGNQKAQYLLSRWKEIIKTIVEFEYDCSFEWRGETNGSHDSYLEDIRQLEKEGKDILKQALSVNGIDRNYIIEKAREECRKWEEAGGWGASRCWNIISNAT
jgi:tetratricopeptide (TPR) repeat protein